MKVSTPSQIEIEHFVKTCDDSDFRDFITKMINTRIEEVRRMHTAHDCIPVGAVAYIDKWGSIKDLIP